MKTIVFTAKSSYARFRCPHTTTSALTFSTIHPIAVKGMIGAILGIEYEELYEYTKDMKIGIEVLNHVYKDTQSFNLIAQTNNNKAPNFQSRVQFLRDVKYRIYVSTTEQKLENIERALKSNEYIFTPYLGCSENIAKLEFEEIITSNVNKVKFVNTVIPQEYLDLEFEDDKTLYFDRIPIENNKDREYIAYNKVAFGVNGEIKIKQSEIFKVGEKNVFFF